MNVRIVLSIILVIATATKAFASGSYALIELKGTVNPVVADYIVQSIEKAKQDNRQFVLLTLDTPGGLLGSTRDIIKGIVNSELPVIVFAYPKGAQAASAGGFIMIAAHVAAMAPGTEIGAMHPVSPFMDFGQEQTREDIMAKKVLNDTVALAKSLAEKRNRNVKWVEQAVREAKSSTNNEALRLNVIDYVANDIDDLLKKIHGKEILINKTTVTLNTVNVQQVAYTMDWREEILNYFANPQIAFILFLIAVVGIGFELKNPGLIIPGAVGGAALFLFLLAIKILPINFAGLVLLIAAIVLFVLELKFTSYGVLTLAGIASFVIGSMILFDSPLPGGQVPLTTIITVLIFLLLFIFVVVRAVIKVHSQRSVTGVEGMIGQKGYAMADFKGKGTVEVHGEIWNAFTREQLVKGDEIEIVKVDGMVLQVKKHLYEE